jgi:hypothetical protein
MGETQRLEPKSEYGTVARCIAVARKSLWKLIQTLKDVATSI